MAEHDPDDSTPPDAASDPGPGRLSTVGLVAGASLTSTALAAYEIVPASVTPVIRTSLGIGSTTAGLLVGVMFGTAVLASLPVGVVLDRTDSRHALGLAVLTLVAVGIWGWDAGRRGDFASLVASRALGGLAFVVVWNAGIDLVSRGVAPTARATAVGVFTASGPLGFAIGLATGPVIAARFGWPAIFVAFTGLGLVGLLVFWPASRSVAAHHGDAPDLAEFGAVLRTGAVWRIGLLGFLAYALYLFVNSWGSSFLTTEVGLPLAESGLLVAVFPAVGVLSRASSGVLSDRVFGGRRRPVILGSFAVAAPLLLAFPTVRAVPVLVPVLLLSGFAVQLTLGLSYTYIREVVDPRLAATAVAFLTSLGLAGAFLSPILGGLLIDRAGYTVAFGLATGLAVLGVVLSLQVPEPSRS